MNQPQAPPVCVRHPDRPTGLRCVRCDRPACPECLREATVGYQCVDCVRSGNAASRRPTTVAGAAVGSTTPVVTYVLIALNVLVFVITAYQARSIVDNQVSPLFASWELLPTSPEANTEWWRMFTAGFLHFGPIHIAMNMISLYVVGRNVEVVLGRLRYVVLYLVAMLGGGVSTVLLTGSASQVAGASGAVFGLIGALLVAVIRLKLDPKAVIFVIVIYLVISFRLPGISWQGHIGGLIVGALLMVAMVYPPARIRTTVQVASTVVLVGVLVALYLARTSLGVA